MFLTFVFCRPSAAMRASRSLPGAARAAPPPSAAARTSRPVARRVVNRILVMAALSQMCCPGVGPAFAGRKLCVLFLTGSRTVMRTRYLLGSLLLALSSATVAAPAEYLFVDDSSTILID